MQTNRPRAKLATVDQLMATVVSDYLDPVPTRRYLVDLFKKENISTMKANPNARNGGGTVWYSVDQVERLLRQKAGLEGFADHA
jgi:hypothetical protein